MERSPETTKKEKKKNETLSRNKKPSVFELKVETKLLIAHESSRFQF